MRSAIELIGERVAAAPRDCVAALGGDDRLATTVEATAHGYAMLLRGGGFGADENAVREAADGAARAVLALVGGWRQLRCRYASRRRISRYSHTSVTIRPKAAYQAHLAG